jgi:D-proline reductase (dithiol) PrdB
VSLTARTLEAGGISTVVIGSAFDIAETCGTPRFVYNDFPLGNPLGKPYDTEMQKQTVEIALQLVDTATEAGTVIETPFHWSADEAWKDNYARVDDDNRDELLRLGDANRKQRALNQSKGLFRK